MGSDEDGERQRREATGRAEPTGREDATSRGRTRFVCEVCGAEFDSEAALRDHVFSQGQVY